MANKIINFSELKRKEIRKTFDNGIEVYNPNDDQKKEIFKIMTDSIEEETGEIEIAGKDIMLKLIPMLTNIKLDLNEDDELLQEILEDPSDELLDTISEIEDIVKIISNRYIRTLNNIKDLPEEEIDKLFNENINENKKDEINEEELKKQKEIEEMEAKLRELKGE